MEKNYYGEIDDVIIRPKALGARNGLYCKKCAHWWFDGMFDSFRVSPCPRCGAKNERNLLLELAEKENLQSLVTNEEKTNPIMQ